MIEFTPQQVSPESGSLQKAPDIDERIMEKAREFEAVFVAQMLKDSGMGKALSQDSGFGGDAFSSILLEQYAGKIVENGGFGLADKIYAQLRSQEV